MRVLILGGSGFIGSRLAAVLGKRHSVVVFGRSSMRATALPMEVLNGNLEDIHRFRSTFEKARFDVAIDMASKNETDARNVTSSLRGVCPRLILMSSISSYRIFGRFLGIEMAEICNAPVKEDAPLRTQLYPYDQLHQCGRLADPKGLLGFDKIPVENCFLGQSDVETCIVRLPMVYGPGDPGGRISYYSKRMTKELTVLRIPRSFTSWRNSRSYIANIADAIATVLENRQMGEIYNLADGGDYTEEEWIRMIAEACRWRGAIEIVPDAELTHFPPIEEFPQGGDFRQSLLMDASRVRDDLGFNAKIAVHEALAATVFAEGSAGSTH